MLFIQINALLDRLIGYLTKDVDLYVLPLLTLLVALVPMVKEWAEKNRVNEIDYGRAPQPILLCLSSTHLHFVRQKVLGLLHPQDLGEKEDLNEGRLT